MDNGVHHIKRDKCTCCFRCVEACEGQALEQSGQQKTVSEVLEAVRRDRRYYDTSGGGVTLTGGEPMSQPEFTEAILEACKSEGINTALETCGFAEPRLFERILPFVDTFLYDIKETDSDVHKEFTGVDNTLILETLKLLAGFDKKIILRCPIIPGLNDRTDHFKNLARMSTLYSCIEGVEIMPYHTLGISKTARLGTFSQDSYETPSEDIVKSWTNEIVEFGGKVIKY